MKNNKPKETPKPVDIRDVRTNGSSAETTKASVPKKPNNTQK